MANWVKATGLNSSQFSVVTCLFVCLLYFCFVSIGAKGGGDGGHVICVLSLQSQGATAPPPRLPLAGRGASLST